MLNSFGVNSWKPVILGDFWQRKGDFYYANNNEEFTIKHREKILNLKFVEGFSELFCINIT